MAVEIIAELGVNHNGDIDVARKLVDEAVKAGAKIVKFQTYEPNSLMRKSDPDFKLLESLALSYGEFKTLTKHCEDAGVEFMTTPGELDSLKFAVEELGIKRIKLGSDDLTNNRLQWAARQYKIPKIQSTGMGTLEETWEAVAALGVDDLTLMHCVSCYPCGVNQANLKAIVTLREYFKLHNLDIPIGYSDHTARVFVIQGAVYLGATMIEAHMMLMDGSPPVDAVVSLTPGMFNTMINAVKLAEQSIGNGIKQPNQQEVELLQKVRKGSDGYRRVCMSVLGLIPARLGSERLPRKNLIDLGGKPLIQWTIDAAVASASFDDLVVSTDSPEIAELAKKQGLIALNRPDELANSDTPMLPVVRHAAKHNPLHDIIVLLQPTSPFRSTEDIILSIQLMKEMHYSADAVISVGAPEPDLCFERGHAQRLRMARNIVVANGALYLITKDHLKVGDWYSGLTYAYEMPASRSLDIDTNLDLTIARAFVKNGFSTK